MSASIFGNNTRQYACIILLDATEVLLHSLLACPISIANFLLILRTSILHPNLKFILLCQSTSIFSRSFGRLIIAAFKVFTGNTLWNGSPLLELIFGFSAFFRNFLAHVLVAERIIATLFVRQYEHARKPHFTIAWFAMICIFALANNMASVATTLTTWTILFVLALCELGIFTWIWRHNYGQFQAKLLASRNHSLSERYQLAENIRTGRQLMPTLCIHFFNITLGALVNWSFYALIFGPVKAHVFLYVLLDQLFYCTIATTNFLIELTMILYHPYLRRNFLHMFALLKSKLLCMARISPAASATEQVKRRGTISRQIESDRMNIRRAAVDLGPINCGAFGNNEADEHFRQLRRAWGASVEFNDIKRKK